MSARRRRDVTRAKREARRNKQQGARIGPCRDPLQLWFLEWRDADGQRWRRYYANRDEARAALRARKAGADADKS